MELVEIKSKFKKEFRRLSVPRSTLSTHSYLRHLLLEAHSLPPHTDIAITCQDPTGNAVHLCEEEDGGVRGGGVTVVKAVESAYPLLRVFVHVKSGGWEREYWSEGEEYVGCVDECEKREGGSEEESSISDRQSQSHSSTPEPPNFKGEREGDEEEPEGRGEGERRGGGGGGRGGAGEEGEGEGQPGELGGRNALSEVEKTTATVSTLADSCERSCETREQSVESTQISAVQEKITLEPRICNDEFVLQERVEPPFEEKEQGSERTVLQQTAAVPEVEKDRTVGMEECDWSLQALSINGGRTERPQERLSEPPVAREEREQGRELTVGSGGVLKDRKTEIVGIYGQQCAPVSSTRESCQSPTSLPPHPLLAPSDKDKDMGVRSPPVVVMEDMLPPHPLVKMVEDEDERRKAVEALDYVVEIYGFEPSLKTRHLVEEFRRDYNKRDFRLKWVDDTHALGIFASSKNAWLTSRAPYPRFKTRILKDGTELSKDVALKVAASMRPCSPLTPTTTPTSSSPSSSDSSSSPKRSAIVVRRMLANALGVRVRVSPEQKEKEEKEVQRAKEEKRARKLAANAL